MDSCWELPLHKLTTLCLFARPGSRLTLSPPGRPGLPGGPPARTPRDPRVACLPRDPGPRPLAQAALRRARHRLHRLSRRPGRRSPPGASPSDPRGPPAEPWEPPARPGPPLVPDGPDLSTPPTYWLGTRQARRPGTWRYNSHLENIPKIFSGTWRYSQHFESFLTPRPSATRRTTRPLVPGLKHLCRAVSATDRGPAAPAPRGPGGKTRTQKTV